MNITELISQAKFTNPIWVIMLPLIWMGADVVSGYINAWIKKDLKSSKMREGLGHKAMETLVLVLCIFIHVATGIKQFEYAVCLYILWMESLSIYENIKKIFNKDIDKEKVEEIAKLINK